MNLNSVLKKSWWLLWHCRALWLFGAVLALAIAITITPAIWLDPENDEHWIKVRISKYSTIRIPGVDMTVDLTAPDGVRIIPPVIDSWDEFRDHVDELNRQEKNNFWPILIEFAGLLIASLLMGLLARYVSETAMIRMVNESENTGKPLGLKAGLRRGFSLRAFRLFLLDLTTGIMAAIACIVELGFVFAPIVMLQDAKIAIMIAAYLGTTGLLFLAIIVGLVVILFVSLVMQPIRRAVVLEDMGLLSSIRHGLRVTVSHVKEVSLLWLIWMGIRLLWIPISGLIAILFAPVLLVTLLLGTLIGGMQAMVVGGFFDLFLDGVTPWIVGALAGLPSFTLVTILPILFVGGLVEIYKSSIWTLGYRDMRVLQYQVKVFKPKSQMVPILEPSD